jgi:hypothetical protein
MARTKSIQTDIQRLFKLLEWQKARYRSLSRKFTTLNNRTSAMFHNQQHYLRHRAPAVLKKQRAMTLATARLYKRMEAIGRQNIRFQSALHSKPSEKNIIFLCSHNDAKKLRTILQMDFRQFNGTKKLRAA